MNKRDVELLLIDIRQYLWDRGLPAGTVSEDRHYSIISRIDDVLHPDTEIDATLLGSPLSGKADGGDR